MGTLPKQGIPEMSLNIGVGATVVFNPARILEKN
jgi:hypothetical protein